MRRKLVVGNWKMNKTLAEASATIEAFMREVDSVAGVEAAICPPYTVLDCARELLRRSTVRLGAQDVFWADAGAFTGKVSAAMLSDLDCTYCIVGHSETRGRFGKLEVPSSTLAYFAESDETVNLKIRALLYCNIRPILCVGETLEEREAGRTDEVIASQLAGAFQGVDGAEYYEGVVAYEPVWAIGTGKVCDADEAERVCGTIRAELGRLLDPDAAQAIRVLYGGSVKAANARELFHRPNIDGGLVGGASLDPDEFTQIVKCAL